MGRREKMKFLLGVLLFVDVTFGSSPTDEIKKEFASLLGDEEVTKIMALEEERPLMESDIRTLFSEMPFDEYAEWKMEVNEARSQGTSFDDDENPLCQLCAGIRLTPRCRKPVDGLPTRPKICRICLIYLVTCIG